MAIQRGRFSDIPTDAVRLSKEEAVDYQIKLMHDWSEWKDVFFFKYGAGFLGGASAAVGIYLNDYYRRKLKLRSYGSVSSFLASSLIPTSLTLVFHYGLIVPHVILKDTCAVCIEIRAASIQSVFGCVVPSLLAPISAFSAAISYGTYNVPYITQPLQVLNLWKQLTKPIGNILFGLFLAQALLASGVTMMEGRSVDIVNKKMEMRYLRTEHD
ncbi:uncharacterized protein [Atheta coriaria]|uniref:uncharacterized protein n=1 Tax=Dalotia coriaria TaxID=877792 RepID=UPI0031F3D4A3